MILQDAKDLFSRLDMEYPAVAIKYCFSRPIGVDHVDEMLSFCQLAKKAQVEHRAFFVAKDDDNCFGKMDWDPIAMSDDEKSKAERRRSMDRWRETSPDFALKD